MQLMELDSADDYVTSVKWLPASVSAANCCLAVGDSSGSVSIWDAERLTKIRTMRGHADRVGCLAWNKVNKEIPFCIEKCMKNYLPYL